MRLYRNIIATLVAIAFIITMFMLSGCTIYKVHSVPGKSVDVSVYSSRSFTAPNLEYTRTGQDATFSFGADVASQPGPQDYAAGVAAGIRAVLAQPPQ